MAWSDAARRAAAEMRRRKAKGKNWRGVGEALREKAFTTWKKEVKTKYPHANFERINIGVVAYDDGTPVSHLRSRKYRL